LEKPLNKLPSIGTAANPNLHKTGQAQWATDGLVVGGGTYASTSCRAKFTTQESKISQKAFKRDRKENLLY